MTNPNNDLSLNELANRVRGGEESAFARLVALTQQRAFSLAFRLVCDEVDAEDITQESFVKVWENIHHYDTSRRFEPWLLRIVTNLALDRLRARKRWWAIFRRTDEVSETEHNQVTDLTAAHANSELAAIIKSLAHTLPERQRTVFVLRDLQECSVAEVSAILHISQESVKTNLHYARKRISDMMHRNYGVHKEAR